MTKEQIRQELERRLSEYFEGYLFVGQVAGTKDIVMTGRWTGKESGERIVCGAVNLINHAREDSGYRD